MAADTVVGILKALLTLDSSGFDTGSKRAASSSAALGKNIKGLTDQVAKLTPQAERMVKSFGGDKLLYQANSLTAAVQKLGGASKLTESEQARVNATVTAAIAKYRTLGQTAPQAMLDLEQATRKNESAFSAFTQKLGMGSTAIAAFAGGFAGAAVQQGISSLIGMGKAAFDTAGHILDMSAKTGLSTATIQRMQFVADQTSGSLEGFTTAAFRLGAALSGGGQSVVKAVKELGLNWEELRRQTQDQQWEAVIAALGRVDDAATRNRLGIALMGKGYATVADAVAQDYAKMADAAQLSTDGQLRALDAAADRWSAFVTNTKTNVTSFLGTMLQLTDAVREVLSERGVFSSTAGVLEEAQRRVLLGLVGARKEDLQLRGQQVKAEESYLQQLAKVRAELAALTPAQRREIEAAQQLGVSTDVLETKYGLTEGALRLLTAQTKEYESAAKKAREEQRKWIEDIETGSNGLRTWLVQLGVVPAAIHDISDELAAMRGQLQGAASGYDELFAHAARMKELRQTGIFGPDVEMENQHISETVEATVREMSDLEKAVRGDFAQMQLAMSDAFAQMLVGARGFKDGFLDVWRSIQQGISRILGDILNDFIGGFLRKIVTASVGGSLLGTATNAAAGIGAGAVGGGTAAGTTAGGGAAGGFLTNPAFWTNPWTIGAAAAGAVLTWGIAKKGWFRGGEEGVQVNPKRDQFLRQFGPPGTDPGSGFGRLAAKLVQWTGSGSTFAMLTSADSLSKLRMAENVIADLYAAHGIRNVQKFNFGGFVPPGAVVPAILHGGAFGEDVVPRGRQSPVGQRSVNIYQTFNARIEGMLSADTAEEFRRKVWMPLEQRARFLNTDFINQHLPLEPAR